MKDWQDVYFAYSVAFCKSKVSTQSIQERKNRIHLVTSALFCVIILFFNTDACGLQDTTVIASLQDQSQMTLSKYEAYRHPLQPFRFGKLLLLLPSLRAVRPSTIEELFFRRALGTMPFQTLLRDLYYSSGTS